MRQETEARLASIRTWFAQHELRSETPGHWALWRRHKDGGWDSAMHVEVIALRHSLQLAVVGDFDSAVFAYGPQDPESRVSWIGRSHISYVVEKASIGGTEAREWDFDVAMEDLRDGVEHGEWCSKEALAEIESELSGERSREEFMNVVATRIDDVAHLGEVPSQRVLVAFAALERLSNILEARRKDAA